MKFLSNYLKFLEEVDVKDSDDQPIKSEKQEVNSIAKFIKEYPQKSKMMDDIYKKYPFEKDFSKRNSEIENLLGKDPDSRNPFLVAHGVISELTTKVKKLTDDMLLDDSKKKNIQSNLSLAVNDETKNKMTKDIQDIEISLTQKKKKLEDYKTEISDKQNKIKSEMADKKIEIEEESKKLAQKQKK